MPKFTEQDVVQYAYDLGVDMGCDMEKENVIHLMSSEEGLAIVLGYSLGKGIHTITDYQDYVDSSDEDTPPEEAVEKYWDLIEK